MISANTLQALTSRVARRENVEPLAARDERMIPLEPMIAKQQGRARGEGAQIEAGVNGGDQLGRRWRSGALIQQSTSQCVVGMP